MLEMESASMYKRYFKRFFDVLGSFAGLILLSPLLLLTAAIIKLDSPGPVLFRQKRLGQGGKEFEIYKFRSMCVDAEHTGSGQYSFQGDPRVTRVGRFLRASSIDELPQLFNILKGEMSVIGFRPPLTYHPWPIDGYTEEQRKMFSLRPGVTGWAQVHGRKDIPWTKRIEMNVWYAENLSFGLDLKIFFMTMYKVLANQDNVNKTLTVDLKTVEGMNRENEAES
jgi:lipopolysaccharide/colanic/teichoic acid biosynthesis glycosyltransferase